MVLNSRLFWHEFRSALPPKGGSMFFVVMALICAASFLWSASPEVKSGEWSGFIAMPIGLVCGLAAAAIMVINPRNPATINKTLPVPFATLIAGRLSAVFLVTAFLPWLFITVAMAVKFPGGFLPTSAMIAVIFWLCFWGFAFFGTLAGESQKEALRFGAIVAVAAFGPPLIYGTVKFFVGRDWLVPNGNADSTLNLLIVLGVFSILLPVLCVSAWRMPFRKISFLWYGPAVLMVTPFIACVPTASLVFPGFPFGKFGDAPRVLASFPADEGGTVNAENFIATMSPVYSDGKESIELEMKSVSLNSPSFKNWRDFRVVLISEESKRFVVLHAGSMTMRGSLLLTHRVGRFQLSGSVTKEVTRLIRPRILLLSGDNFADNIRSGSTTELRIPECFAYPPQLPISEDTSGFAAPPVAPLVSPVAP